jgi:hypothetical protein
VEHCADQEIYRWLHRRKCNCGIQNSIGPFVFVKCLQNTKLKNDLKVDLLSALSVYKYDCIFEISASSCFINQSMTLLTY